MTNEAEGGGVARTGVVVAPAIQQPIKRPSLLTGLVTGPTAEEGMGAVVDQEKNTI